MQRFQDGSIVLRTMLHRLYTAELLIYHLGQHLFFSSSLAIKLLELKLPLRYLKSHFSLLKNVDSYILQRFKSSAIVGRIKIPDFIDAGYNWC